MIELTKDEALNMDVDFWTGRHTHHVNQTNGHVFVLTRAEVLNGKVGIKNE